MTKAELKAEVEELRRRVDMLEARLIIAEQQRTVVLPAPSYPLGPWWQYPYTVTCGTTNSLTAAT